MRPRLGPRVYTHKSRGLTVPINNTHTHSGEEEGGGVRSGPGEARTILLLHIISAGPSKQPLMVRTFLKVYMELCSYFVLQEQIKDIIIITHTHAHTHTCTHTHMHTEREREDTTLAQMVVGLETSQ